ncbi:MAG: D-tyrosyl-tRNA(Tyr) deacylase [Firmicutes bacterium]|nr:D-tyrosyl-tRNA(Tyr) deacylase [Bacillota bacterium]
MRAVLQRVSRARVKVRGKVIGEIGPGFLILLGVEEGDTEEDLAYLLKKTSEVRIFPDDRGRFNLTPKEVGAEMLVVSQFTLLGDCRKGRRPNFSAAAHPDEAKALYQEYVAGLRELGFKVQEGEFAAYMQVELVNDGPVTLLLDSRRRF